MLIQIICSFVWSCFPFIIIFYVANYLAKVAAHHIVGNTIMSSEQSSPSLEDTESILNESKFMRAVNESEHSRGNSSDSSAVSNLKTSVSEDGFWEDAKNTVNIFDVKHIMSKYYAVNDSVFVEMQPTMADDEEYCDYQLYKVMKTDDDSNVRGSEASDDEDFDEHLDIIQDQMRNGRIINNNVFITHEQWHTIGRLDDDLYSCAVCKLHTDKALVSVHMAASFHLRNLSDYQPLKKFDLSITRKIKDNLHCAVCNTIYPLSEYREHESSKEHEGNLLFAINKVSDIANQMYTDVETQSIERNNIRPPNNEPSTQNSMYSNINMSNTYCLNANVSNTYTQNANVSNTYSLNANVSNTYSLNANVSNSYSLNANVPNTYTQNANVSNLYGQLIAVPTTSFNQNTGYDQNANSISAQNNMCKNSHYMSINGQNTDITMSQAFRNDQCTTSPNLDVPNTYQITDVPNTYQITDVPNTYQNASNTYQNTPEHSNIHTSHTSTLMKKEKFFNDDYFSFGNTFKSITIYEEDDEIEEYVPPIEGISYASMASRPRVEIPKFLKIDLGDKEVRVKFESWHMITQTDPNNYYCMACQTSFFIRLKRQHCLEKTHCDCLDKCYVVGAFEDYLIRNVSDKLYHCGHCNNLQVKNDMQVHVEKYHPKPNRPVNINTDFPTDRNSIIIPKNEETTHKNTYNSTDRQQIPPKIDRNTINIPKNEERTQKNTYNSTDRQQIPPKIDRNTINIPKNEETTQKNTYNSTVRQQIPKIDIFGDFKFAPFGSEMTVSNLACHTIMLVNNTYTCALCDVCIEGELINHVYKVNHMQLMNMTPFIKPFNSNLTRAIRGYLHCALCNVLIKVNKIKEHNMEAAHISSLAKSLGMKKNERPRQEIKYHYQEPSKPDTRIQDEFLNALPSKSREAVKSIKIKNPSGETVFMSNSMDFCKAVPASNLNKLPNLQTGQVVSLKMVDTPLSPIKLKITGPVDSNGGLGQVPVLPIKLEDVEKQLLSKYQDASKHTEANVERKLGNTERNVEIPERNVESPERKVDTERNLESAERNVEITERKDTNKPGKAKKAISIIKEAFSSDEEEILPEFRLEEIVLLKLKSSYLWISNASYHTLVHVGNGARYCFICSNILDYSMLQKHVDSRDHFERLSDNKFLYNFYGAQLFRQMYRKYHCAICNVLMTRNEVKMHLEWPKHIEKYNLSSKKLPKKVLKDKLKSGVKEITVETQKEHDNPVKCETTFNGITYVQSLKRDFVETFVEKKFVKKSRMIILKGNVMKVPFESWHGLLVSKNGAKCIICQEEMDESFFEKHLDTNYHNVALGITFEKQFYPALIRRINEITVNCVICNLELPSDDSLIFEHINGRKHDKYYKNIIKISNTDSYTDCYEDPLTL